MHDCSICGGACYCHGDIDDFQVELPTYSYEHCDGCGCQEDAEFEDDGFSELDVDPSTHPSYQQSGMNSDRK